MSRITRRQQCDQRICDSWNRHEDGEISTERLLSMVCDDTKCDVTRVILGLRRGGILGEAEQ